MRFAASPLAAAEGADALVIVTEWKEFRTPDFARLRAQLAQPVLFDGRNLYDPALVRAAGIEYYPHRSRRMNAAPPRHSAAYTAK